MRDVVVREGVDGRVGSLPGEGTFELSLISQKKVRARCGKEPALPFLWKPSHGSLSPQVKTQLAPKEGLPSFFSCQLAAERTVP